jgi:hypothetical protein
MRGKKLTLFPFSSFLFSLFSFLFPFSLFAEAALPTPVSAPVWRGALGGMALSQPACRDGAVVVVCEGGFVRAFSYEGRGLWTYRIRGRFAPFVTRGPDGLTWVSRDEPGGPRNLIALNRVGKKILELYFDKPLSGQPKTGYDGRVFVPFADGAVVYTAAGVKLGKAVADFPPEEPVEYPGVSLSMTRAEGRTPDGHLRWFLDLEGAAALPAYNGEGLVIAGGRNWLLAAFRVDDGTADGATLGPAKRYGLSRQLNAPDWVTLSYIEAALDAGTVDGNEAVFASFLRYTSRITPRSFLTAEVLTERARALRLLGRLGSPEYMPFLVDVFLRDGHPDIRAAAAAGMGAIGIDREGKALAALSAAVLPVMPLRNERVIEAALEAAAKICLVNGPPLTGQGLSILGMYRVQKTYPALQPLAAVLLEELLR